MAFKKRNKQRKKLYKQRKKEASLSGLPVERAILIRMFAYLDKELAAGCSHDYTIVNKFIKRHNLPATKLLSWFQENGGYCDCEVLFNVEQQL